MKIRIWVWVIIFLALTVGPFRLFAQSAYVSFHTAYGNFKVMLYDYTPNHKAMFLEAMKHKVYQRAFFNRIVQDFVVQGGGHDKDIASLEEQQGYKNPRLNPEFDIRAFHKIGALGAGRDDNPEKASFRNQIYLVVGKKYTEQEFDDMAQKYQKIFTPERRAYYIQHGGLPRLDGDYTVFGEVVEGLDVVMKISKVSVDEKHFPKKKVRFRVKILTS